MSVPRCWTVTAAALLVGWSAAAAPPRGMDSLDTQLRNGADKAINCGIVELDGKTRLVVNRCVADAIQKKHEFFARYNRGGGIDSEYATGLRRLEDGTLVMYSFDSSGCMIANAPPTCGLILQRYGHVTAVLQGPELILKCSGELRF